MGQARLRVGELARRTGVSVRTLHHYDAIGLLAPARDVRTGYRWYGDAEISRLEQIVSLRQVGFSLDEIRACLDERRLSLQEVLDLHLRHLEAQLAQQQRLYQRLQNLARTAPSLRSAEELIEVIKEITMFEKYYTPEQLSQLERRRQSVGDERIAQVEAEWPALMAEVQVEMDQGTDPADPRVLALAQRWMGLVREFTGGDAGINQALTSMYEQESEVHGMATGPMRAMWDYVQRALTVSPDPAR